MMTWLEWKIDFTFMVNTLSKSDSVTPRDGFKGVY